MYMWGLQIWCVVVFTQPHSKFKILFGNTIETENICGEIKMKLVFCYFHRDTTLYDFIFLYKTFRVDFDNFCFNFKNSPSIYLFLPHLISVCLFTYHHHLLYHNFHNLVCFCAWPNVQVRPIHSYLFITVFNI